MSETTEGRAEPGAAQPLHEFKPDWCMAPAGILRWWIEDTGVQPRMIAVVAGGRDGKDKTLPMVEQVLNREPLTEDHARVLERGTHVPARFWLALEQNYRAGLAAGLKDVTD